jgi:hypothetical protein
VLSEQPPQDDIAPQAKLHVIPNPPAGGAGGTLVSAPLSSFVVPPQDDIAPQREPRILNPATLIGTTKRESLRPIYLNE